MKKQTTTIGLAPRELDLIQSKNMTTVCIASTHPVLGELTDESGRITLPSRMELIATDEDGKPLRKGKNARTLTVTPLAHDKLAEGATRSWQDDRGTYTIGGPFITLHRIHVQLIEDDHDTDQPAPAAQAADADQ